VSEQPPVTCLCPTYGRFERLRDAVACFLLQDYARKRLVILNDAPQPLVGETPESIRVVNRPERYPTLGHKRQALLEMADTSLVAHWDDDDLYLPWHISRCAEMLQTQGAGCVKARAAWWASGPRSDLRVVGVRHNVFEGQMVFDRAQALRLGGYPPRVSGQAAALLGAFSRAGLLHTWEPEPRDISYVYRWGDGVHHISGGGDTEAAHCRFGQRNADFGHGQPLLPDADPAAWARHRMVRQFGSIAKGLARLVPPVAPRPQTRIG